ncbi:MAG: ADP-glyceromanno-heptose 6-epimerase [Betaproteobacteria bacterium]|nr:ADP-glyceromanno-heptose 6-epimerase [Betaproteobacteria bacterium]NCV55105.1 ADP-glyceromanno-heptose 6-epimerase [Betaproteobacteria bacterium]NCX63570.1 ADP-glyceromanno-heptose 6-epimerase [Betaproteobacteria bacterium]NCZ82258.1 ADP-glyceromanno-heptose 6-epimerase [Betaproteobacteria bacterium]NDA21372.1 ADP-glyceromanno-heptose 6-epimerase [Betaproteobacteria bacterium]
MIIVTGAAGFIGSQLVKALNQRGETEILAVDNLSQGDKFRNLISLDIADYMDKSALPDQLRQLGKVEAVFHQGACSDTTASDGRYILQNNYTYSTVLLNFCQDRKIPFVYASSAATYGDSGAFKEKASDEAPLNLYGYSKLLFDRIVRRRLSTATAPIAGLRYFNVYGPGEAHKGRMASVAYHHVQQWKSQKQVRLFGSYDGWDAGEQQRDFIAVQDVVAINCWMLDHPEVGGIFNLGTGKSASFNQLAQAVINACRRKDQLPDLSLQSMQSEGLIRYVDFPEDLKGKYQSFTQADISKLRDAGCEHRFMPVNEGVEVYVDSLFASRP